MPRVSLDKIAVDDNIELVQSSTSLEMVVVPNQLDRAKMPDHIPLTWKQIKGKDGRIYTFDENNKLVCGAKKKNGTPCKDDPMRGRNRCRRHGGKSPIGIAHANFKTGERSRAMPVGLAKAYNEALSDPKLLEHRRNIALSETRLVELLKRVDTGESGVVWRQVKRAYNDMRSALKSHDQIKTAESIEELGRLITKGHSDYAAWEEVSKVAAQQRRHIESENKRLVQMKQMMTAEQAMALMAFVVSVIKKHVKDKQQLAAISAEITAYVAMQSVPSPISNNSEY